MPDIFSLKSSMCMATAYAPAYGIRGLIRAGRVGLTPEQEAINVVMSKYWIVVEWGVGNILNQFTSRE